MFNHNPKPCYPRLTEASRVLNDSSCNSWSTEAGVLVDNHQPRHDLSRSRYVLSLEESNTTPTISIPPGEASFCLLIRQQLIRVLETPRRGEHVEP
ncbi:hypothetical protein AVEN_115074-1 [Araneus ventricosus]|uniref:Uncharacterized protein n=1 Tax=Araneus ventricosus TaxID=182803 RepID=A0A4Y1ZY01_ARAVE|nr:hypothetical protein AVEN_115074-1 [Araneus ventricosus]